MPVVNGVYAMNPQVAAAKAASQQPQPQQAQPQAQGKESAEQAGYMELQGAQKDADCSKVQVDGGVSSELGCCNEFQPNDGAQEFECGQCQFLQASQEQPNASSQQSPAPSNGDSGTQP